MSTHTSHPAIIKRLKRANGHLASIVTMLEEQRACLDIVQQLQAVESAINSAKKALIHDHIGECLMHTIGPDNTTRQQVLEEFQAITKYL
ncbi:hypothetical protein NreA [Duganella sacchari]|uniref:DNA-binding transcriptional regulator, FrmR family n=1 Tax=Duganella sacchari TaxID=551987 RepID=A0A1M7KQX7_9BURK|nr:metal-sensing transcriptional repressor [Duganella sacchari]SHM67889.1 hypothetical protein NreA [Duganella sacchari]